jgi:CubicO group peptidase (beta-lactamase class C family)
MRFDAVALVLGILIQSAAAADVAPEKVDQIFAGYNKAGSPGCSLGVIRNGDFVYRKAYGLGSLELGVPLTSESAFYMGSVSKQFTAAAVVLAAEQGFLSLDDDVRKYIPELPNYDHVITLRQMLHHTSGFRDFFDLIDLSGRDALGFNSPREILGLIARQKGLNNTPGDEFIYSNTNYFLLGVVIQRATKMSLADFTAQKIFQPLGMSHTLFYDDHTLVVPGRVSAYDPGAHANFLVDWSTTYAIVGGGGLLSTVDDLLLWDRNFYANALGKRTLTKELQNRGILNDGKQISYAMGLDMGNYRGLPIVEHDGELFGYRTSLLRFPEQRFTVICLCNLSSAVPANLSRMVAELYLADYLKPGASALNPADNANLSDPAIFAGKYLDPRTHMIYSFTAVNRNLMAWGGVLRRISADQFCDLESNVITFEKVNGAMKATLVIEGETYFAGMRVEEAHLTPRELAVYAGRFHSEELDTNYDFSVEQGALLLRIGNNPMTLNAIAPDQFEVNDLGAIVVFRWDDRKRLRGLGLFSQSTRGVEFERTN